jgi:replication factor C small subunit
MSVEKTLWVEKHRPETLDDIIGHDDQIARLKKYVHDDEVPHMIFAGPPGTGKTAAITAFAREVFGDNWRSNLDEMNASDERGIDTVRNKIKGIARSSPAGGAPFSILFLDEADALTTDAQKPLRRIMEDHSDVTRFFMSCNYPNQIIEAIQSRCSMFRFGRLNDEEVRRLLERIAEKESLEYEDVALDKIVRESRGDARSAVNSLQSSAIEGEVTEDSVETVIGVINDYIVEEIVDLAIEGETDEAMRMLDVELLKAGANTQLLADSFLRVIKQKDFPAPGKRKVIHKLAECDWRINQAANPNIQWHSFIQDINAGYHLTLGSYDNGGGGR